MPFIHSNGIELAYEVDGPPDGEPLLLVAGLGLQLISWPPAFCEGLVALGFRVIRFDNRDCGLSTKLDEHGKPNLHLAFFKSMFQMPITGGYTLYDMARDAVGLLDSLKIESAHVVGASMGGMIAQILAARHAVRVRSLTSIMSTSGRPGLPGPTMAAHHAIFSRPRDVRDMNSIIDHTMHVQRVIGSPRYPIPDDVLRERAAASVQRSICVRGTARQVMAVAATGDRSESLRTIAAPTLVIHGTADPLVPVAAGRDTARLIPGAVLHEIDGMGHDFPPQLDQALASLIGNHCLGGEGPEMREA